ncbi:MAG: glycosyltransferase family 8 protein [Rickettsiales bacterium]|jgi:lipopolysaccharide biosynthesis glycosyltransferase|nr:glycosyltransferase family 8 protein [Rickettsiales bacterium]
MSQHVPIAFCFDNGYWMCFGVAITSLLFNSSETHYDIYCISDIAIDKQEALIHMVSALDKDSKMTFIKPNNDFDESIGSASYYYRLMLPKLLPHLDSVIYADCDMIFCESLLNVWNESQSVLNEIAVSGGGNGNSVLLFAVADIVVALKQVVGKRADFVERELDGDYLSYINSGFLIMNLKGIREEDGLYNKMVERSKDNSAFELWDQGVLNICCKGRIYRLHIRYNFFINSFKNNLPSEIPQDEKGILKQAIQAIDNPVTLHYVGKDKPWNYLCFNNNCNWFYNNCFNIWWTFAQKTPFYHILWGELMRNMIEYKTAKYYPKFLVKMLCLFIPKKEKRKYIRMKYVKKQHE